MKTFVQIGLWTTFEYAYLAAETREDFFRLWKWCVCDPYKHSTEWILPDFPNMDYKTMRVVGVDMNPYSIEALRPTQGIKDNPNIEFINAAVWDKNIEHFKHNAWEVTGNVKNTHKEWEDLEFATPCMTLQRLLEKIGGDILGVHIDVEGAEVDIFNAFDWSVKPPYFCIEVHHGCEKEIQRIFNANGYLTHEQQYSPYGCHIKFLLDND